MREVALDTETTGLEVAEGHRIIAIGCVEMLERRRSGRQFARYVNPERPVEEQARAVHGLDDVFLSDKPPFSAVADDFLRFIRGSVLVMHNAEFDLAFLDEELRRCRLGTIKEHVDGIVDTLVLARRRFPGARASLDALCRRLNVDNSERLARHDALLDAALLARLYPRLVSPASYEVGEEKLFAAKPATGEKKPARPKRAKPYALSAPDREEENAWTLMLEGVKKPLWRLYRR